MDVAAAMLLSLLALLAGTGHARSAGAGEAIVEIERLTWMEIRDRIAAGHRTVIVPTGGTEQNGPHMVTGKHNIIVAETARRIARALGDALVAPVLAYVPEGDPAVRAGHMAYPGTISLPEPAFAQVLQAAALSHRTHGFETIVLLGDSGGNQAVQAEVALRLDAAWRGTGTRVVNAAAYYADNGGDAHLAGLGYSAAAIGTHAGLRDTSELIAVDPTAVRADLLGQGGHGASGDARAASAELGRRLLQLKVEAAVAEIRRARSAPIEERAEPVGGETGLIARLKRWILG